MLAYIDAGTAAAIAAVATGGLAGAKVAAQSFMSSFKKKPAAPVEEAVETVSEELDEVDVPEAETVSS